MPKVHPVTRGKAAGRLRAALRTVPHRLREDLWTHAAEEPPAAGGRPPGWLEWRPAIMVPLLIGAIVLLAGNTNIYAFGYGMGMPLAVLAAGMQAAALVLVLYRPVLAWWATTAVLLLAGCYAALHVDPFTPFGPEPPWRRTALLAQAAVLFLAALRVRPRATAEMLALGALAGLLADGLCLGGPLIGQLNGARLPVTVLALCALIGALLRGRQKARTELVVQEKLTAEERARRTLLEERNRIARELHDVVAHHMSVISIQAQVAPHLTENPSDELKDNLRGIRQNAVEALTELRRVLGVLRSEDVRPEHAPHAPQPTLDRLDELVGNVRGAGVPVTVDTTGTPRPLSPGTGLSAFRIVQEALSNAMRHAPGAAVHVALGYRPDRITLRVTNTAPDRPAPPSPGTGHGLLGMHERSAMLGGELATGPTPDGGYEVTAILPAPAAHAAPSDDAEDTR
ncbi:sensor histidine kinase [Streptomyces yunnanensis]|uniref:histidine kinase n=1 Tax=Streptomyces yunnanensis TaxID=156453 RepID=A0ABY8A1Y3_9ACTN|nr:sensor histidine kinase [Streptomyces yunnanensis]WEB38945.1 sensor histidine kinase [Streptomyces yunnanensis]